MESWKRTYKNCHGDYAGAMAQLWGLPGAPVAAAEEGAEAADPRKVLFDPAGWSIFVGRFKYNGENGRAFMVSNSINGFIQRSGEIRKWLFGVMWVTGEEGLTPLEITCCYMIRGQTIEPLKVCNDDAEHYNWVKIDHTSAEGRALVKEVWCSSNGKFEYLEGKKCVAAEDFK